MNTKNNMTMENKKTLKINDLHNPKLRVSQKVYIRIIYAAMDEAVFMPADEGIELVNTVRAYLSSGRNAPLSGDRVYKPFRKFRDLIDKAAERSAKAREAARRRRERREAASRSEAPAETHRREETRDETKATHGEVPRDTFEPRCGEASATEQHGERHGQGCGAFEAEPIETGTKREGNHEIYHTTQHKAYAEPYEAV